MLTILSYPRAFVISLFTGFQTLFISSLVLLLTAIGFSRERVHKFIRFTWAKPIFWLANIEVEVRGEQNLPPQGQGFLTLFNHTSNADIMALYGYLPRFVCFGAKIELFKIPFFGRAMLKMGALPIDRRLREKVLKLYAAAIPRVAAGDAFALAPEGTRQKEPILGNFKMGPFMFAVQAQMKIVPVVIAGAYEVLPKSSLWLNKGAWHRKIIMEILEPTSTAGMNDENLESLQRKVRDQMFAAFERLKLELLRDQTVLAKNL
jgi:1-acyl-sn-glycerol-3-phosphate acyltransferase